MTGPTRKDLARPTDPAGNRAAGTGRRFGVASTSRVIWRLEGVRTEAGPEPVDAEVFAGIGIYARPGADGKPEAIVINIGDARHPVIVATRDEDAARAVRGQLGTGLPAAGETLVFASVGGAVVYLKSDGTVEIRMADGTAAPLAFQAVIAALKTIFDGWTPVPMDGGGALKTALAGWHPGDGTEVLKGQ